MIEIYHVSQIIYVANPTEDKHVSGGLQDRRTVPLSPLKKLRWYAIFTGMKGVYI